MRFKSLLFIYLFIYFKHFKLFGFRGASQPWAFPFLSFFFLFLSHSKME